MTSGGFDLTAEPWIPVGDGAGSVVDVNLRDALVNAHELGELQSESPLVTAGILRFLLAAAYRASGPEDPDRWAAMWDAGRLSESAIDTYLRNSAGQFDLFSEERPFMQVAGFSMKSPGSVAQLATEAAAGNNPTLFDHTTDDAPPALSPAEAARWLLASQSFSLGFGKAGAAVVDGKELARPYFADAICLRGVTVWLSGKDLFQTLMLNLVPVPRAKQGQPAWERPDALATLDRIRGKDRVTTPSEGPADRYTWLSRMIRLVRDGDGRVRRAYFTQGREADKRRGDPMKVFTDSKTEGEYPLGLSAGKAAWRDVGSYLVFGRLRNAIVEHAGLQILDEVLPRTAAFPLHVVGLATDPGKAGKFLLWRHDRVELPAALLADADLVEFLRNALRDAEFVGRELGSRVRAVAWRFLPPEGNPDPKDVDHLAAALDPRPRYWARLERHFASLVFRLPTEGAAAIDPWRRQVEQEARLALNEACGRLGATARALRAVAQVSHYFRADEAEVTIQRKDAAARKSRAEARGGAKA